MMNRKTTPLPLPGAELARLRETLSPDYGSETWQGEGQRLLIVRVPRDEPDIVNDLEQAVEYLTPADVTDTPTLLLVGHQKTHILPTQPLKDLMAARIQFDRRQCHLLRNQLKPGEQRLFKAPEDPRRLVRLAVRLSRAWVKDLDDSDLQAITQILGPVSKTPAYQDVRALYLIADRDEVRMDAELFFQDLRRRWDEEDERRRLAQEIVQKEQARRIQEEAERQAVLGRDATSHPSAPPQRVTVAPMRRAGPTAWESEMGFPGPAAARNPEPAPLPPLSADRAAMYAHLDALAHPARKSRVGIEAPFVSSQPTGLPSVAARPVSERAPVAYPETGAHAAIRNPPVPSQAPAGAPAVAAVIPAPTPAAIQALAPRLTQAGFDVLLSPKVGSHSIDLAAERAKGFPQRLIAFAPERLTRAVADQVLAAARDVQADQALVICDQADPDARKRFIATAAKWLPPADVPTLQF